ncbi:MAG TPA: Rieske (2Fe-2S) protein [Tepidisphaeraceae bacterium]|nr:Rieske (2Fe-2S) protein [Tepidisphaeraceae bacterium]
MTGNPTNVNRREFVILTCSAAAAACAGCSSVPIENAPIVLHPAAIDAGPVASFAADGVYDRFVRQGFFVIRRGRELIALSSICTHRTCKLRAEPDHSFYCKCHGSTFDQSGHVTEGPATRDLPVLPTTVDEGGHLIVRAIAATRR